MTASSNIILDDVRYRFYWLKYWLRYIRETRKKVLVNGSQKTGTTWLLNLVASIPGYGSAGNFLGDIQRYYLVRPGNVVHGHDLCSPELVEILQANDMRVVVTLRDPRDVVVSWMFQIRRHPANPWRAQMLPLTYEQGILACIEGRPGLLSIVDHMQISRSWLSGLYPVCCIRYEEISQRPRKEAERVFQFLDIPVSQEFLDLVVYQNRFERRTVGRRLWKKSRQPGQENPASHFRKGIFGDWKNYFTETHKERFKEVAGQLLIDLEYEKDFSW